LAQGKGQLPSGRHLEAQATITSPVQGAKVGKSFTITGTASLEVLEDTPEGPHKSLSDATASITGVTVRVGDSNQFKIATPTGSGTTPWATWSYAANTTVPGLQTITAGVSISDQPGDHISKQQHSITVNVGQ
jgi:hypothetical protein